LNYRTFSQLSVSESQSCASHHSIRIVLLSRYVNIYDTMAPMSDTGVPDDSHNDGLFENDGHFEPITLPTPSASPSATTQDGGGRPPRVRKQVSRLIPSFEGKSYGTTMAQVSGEMVGMTLS